MASAPSKSAASLDSIIEVRKGKAERVRARGENPFANDLSPDASWPARADIATVRALADAAQGEQGRYDADAVSRAVGDAEHHVTGRIIALRSTGGLSFLRLRDGTGELQLLVSEAQMGASYSKLDDLDVGDIVQAHGPLIASKRGELSIETRDLRLLTKALRPLPEKWHGLTDVEIRYRQRYVDLIANPNVGEVFRARALIVRTLRRLLDDAGFLEVETPTMHSLLGGAAARPFETHHNTLDLDLYMRIAPELYLKRLLVGGFDRVYEIGRNYRNEGISTRHNPEFTMLEFYQAYATYTHLMDFGEALIRGIDEALAKALPKAHAGWANERPFTLAEPFVRLPMNAAVEAAAKKTGIEAWQASYPLTTQAGDAFLAMLKDVFENRPEEMKAWAKSSPRAKAVDWGNFRRGYLKCPTDGDRLFSAYEYLAEPFLADDYRSADGAKSLPVFVKDFPFETSPLARKNDASPHLVDRFELFVHGRELCNAFSELNDPIDQAARFQDQVDRKAAGAEETMDYDEDYVCALEHGMPPAAGFGMGIDRLVMMLTHQASIRDVILFPLLRPHTDAPAEKKSAESSGNKKGDG